MYKQINILKDTNGLYIVSEKLYTFLNDKKILGEFSLDGKLLWSTEPSNIYYRYNIRPKLILYYKERKKQELYILNRESKDLLKIDNINLDITSDNCYWENILVSFVNDKIIKYNLNTYTVVSEEDDDIKGCINFTTDNYIITQYNSYIYLYKKSDFSLLWQKDIRDFFNKEDSKDNQLRIQEVYAYKDNFIVVSTFGILCLNQQNGELIWKTESYARTMEIIDNFGYVCTGGSLYRVNLDKGEMYDYGREYAHLPDFEYEGKSYWASGHRVVFYDGLLWYLVYDSGDSFVIAIDPENAEYQWIHKIDTYEKADEIQFHQDKMFISDTGGNLFIYEKI